MSREEIPGRSALAVTAGALVYPNGQRSRHYHYDNRIYAGGAGRVVHRPRTLAGACVGVSNYRALPVVDHSQAGGSTSPLDLTSAGARRGFIGSPVEYDRDGTSRQIALTIALMLWEHERRRLERESEATVTRRASAS